MKNRLNKFELTRLIGARAFELVEGAKPKIELKEDKIYLEKDYVKVAKEELEKEVIDLEIYKEE